MPNLIEVQKNLLRPVPPGREARGRPARRGAGGRIPFTSSRSRISRRILAPRICGLSFRRAEIRRRGVPAALHDLCRAAQGDAAPDRVRCGPGNRRQVGQGHQGTGCLHGRRSVHDRERHLRRQRHRARDRLARCTARRASSSITTRARPIRAASCCSPRASFPIAARGSISNSTPRTSCMSASTAAASCRRRRCSMRWA